MLVADLIALIVVSGGIGLTARWLIYALRSSEAKRYHQDAQSDKKNEDLRAALASKDYRKLEDFMVVWADHIEPKALEYIKQRRDELYLEENN